MILSTEDHQDIMKAVATKTSTQLSLLPAVSSTRADHTSLPETDVSHSISGVFAFMVIVLRLLFVEPSDLCLMLYCRR